MSHFENEEQKEMAMQAAAEPDGIDFLEAHVKWFAGHFGVSLEEARVRCLAAMRRRQPYYDPGWEVSCHVHNGICMSAIVCNVDEQI